MLLAKLRVVTPLPLRGLDEKLVQLRCVDQAGHDPVRCDASSSQLLRQAEGHVVERGLRGAVGREMRVWRDGVSRRDLDQTPPAALFHRRRKGMDQSNRGDRVLMVVVDPFLKGGVEPRVVGLLSGIADVIHEDIDAVESRFGSLNNIIRSILGRYIAKNKFRLAANPTDFLDNGCCPIPTPAVDYDSGDFTGPNTRAFC